MDRDNSFILNHLTTETLLWLLKINEDRPGCLLPESAQAIKMTITQREMMKERRHITSEKSEEGF